MTATLALRPIVKDYATTLRARTGQPLRRECWEATTADGLWAFERIEDVGTPWVVTYKPRTPEAEACYGLFGTLKSARTAVEKGWVKPPSQWAAEHAAGLHDGRWTACVACEPTRDELSFERPRFRCRCSGSGAQSCTAVTTTPEGMRAHYAAVHHWTVDLDTVRATEMRYRELLATIRRCWCGGEDGEHNADAHAEEGRW